MEFLDLLTQLSNAANTYYQKLEQETAVQEYHNAINAWSKAKMDWFNQFLANPYKIDPETNQPYYMQALDDFNKQSDSFKQFISDKFLTKQGKEAFENYFTKDVLNSQERIFQQALQLHKTKLRYDFNTQASAYIDRGDKEGLINLVQSAQQVGTISDVEAEQTLSEGFLNIALREKALQLDTMNLDEAMKYMSNPANWTYTDYDGTTRDIPLNKREQFQQLYTQKVKDMDNALYIKGLSMFNAPIEKRMSPDLMYQEIANLQRQGLGRANPSHYKILIDMVKSYEREIKEKVTGTGIEAKRLAFENQVLMKAYSLWQKGYSWDQISLALEPYFSKTDENGRPLFTATNFMHVRQIIQDFDKNSAFESMLKARIQSAYKYAPRLTVDRVAQEARQMYRQQLFDKNGNYNLDQQAITELLNKAFSKIRPFTYAEIQSIIQQSDVTISMVQKRGLLGKWLKGEYKGIDLSDATKADEIEQLEQFISNYGFAGLSAEEFEKYKPLFKNLAVKQWKQFEKFATNPVYEDLTGGFDPTRGFFITPWGEAVFQSKNGKYWSIHVTPYGTGKKAGLIDTFDEWQPPSTFAYIANTGEIMQVRYVYQNGEWVEKTTKAIGFTPQGQIKYKTTTVPIGKKKNINKAVRRAKQKPQKPEPPSAAATTDIFSDLGTWGGGL